MKKLMIVAIAVMALAIAMPASAVDYSFYGDSRMDTYSANTDKKWNATAYDDRDTEWDQSKILSRFGVKAAAGDVAGHIELRPHTGSYVRHWYGTWNFGSGTLLVGKTWAVGTFFTNAQNYGDNGYGSYGNLNLAAARVDQIRLTFGSLKIGFQQPNTSLAALADTDTTLPQIEVMYSLNLDSMRLDFFGGYNSYDMVNATDNGYSVTSYIGAIAFNGSFGPATIDVEFHMGTNMGDYGQNIVVDQGADWDATRNEVRDNTGYGYCLNIGFKASDTISINAGYSYIYGEDDRADNLKDEDAAQAFYINVPIVLAPGVTISPELSYFDKMDRYVAGTKTEEGNLTAIGATWRIAW